MSEEACAFEPLTTAPDRPSTGVQAGLTAREQEELGQMADGLTTTEIADRFFARQPTVTSHASSILGTLGLVMITAAVANTICTGMA